MFSIRRKQADVRQNGVAGQGDGKGKEKKTEAPPKKMPVFFIDEAHKL